MANDLVAAWTGDLMWKRLLSWFGLSAEQRCRRQFAQLSPKMQRVLTALWLDPDSLKRDGRFE